MEKINVAELLRNCPRGMELDCTMFDDVTFEYVDDTNNISIKTPCGITQLSKYGCYHSYDCAKCIIFPKGKTTWEGFVPPCQFKVGDTITNGKISITIGYIDDNYYYEIGRNIATRLFIKNQDEWNLVPDKFDITTLVPFESRVLVRDCIYEEWKASFWGYLTNNCYKYNYNTIRGNYKQCIPYEGNEHLLGTTNDCDEYFKTWE